MFSILKLHSKSQVITPRWIMLPSFTPPQRWKLQWWELTAPPGGDGRTGETRQEQAFRHHVVCGQRASQQQASGWRLLQVSGRYHPCFALFAIHGSRQFYIHCSFLRNFHKYSNWFMKTPVWNMYTYGTISWWFEVLSLASLDLHYANTMHVLQQHPLNLQSE